MNSIVQKSGHFSWCALIALHMAKKDRIVLNKFQENMFLINWLKTARKQHRFPRETSADIDWLIMQGKKIGKNAQLAVQLEYLWQVSSGEKQVDTDLTSLTAIIEKSVSTKWAYFLLNDKDWSGKKALSLDPNKDGIFLSLSSVNSAFDDHGMLIRNILAKITGDINWLEKIMKEFGWGLKSLQSKAVANAYEIYKI